MIKNVRPGLMVFKRLFIIIFIIGSLYSGCTKIKSEHQDEYLIRIGTITATVSDFNKALSLARTAYPADVFEDKATFKALQLRTLNQMIEEIILRKQAGENNISVSDDELQAEVSKIKKDYPEEEFEQELLESVVTYQTWESALMNRLLMEKVVTILIAPGISVTPEEITEYVRNRPKEDEAVQTDAPDTLENEEIKEDEKTDDEKVMDHLRRIKIEEAYRNWIDSYKDTHDIDINDEEWLKIIGG